MQGEPIVRIEHFEYLLKVVECGSMNKAAKELFCSQPALSAAIKALEQELGYPLITRTAQGVELTGNGKLVTEEARIILNTINGWKQLSAAGPEQINVGLAYRGLISHAHLIRIMTQLSQEHPNINLNFYPDTSLLSPSAPSGCRIGIVVRVPQHYQEMMSFVERNDLRAALLYEDIFVLYMNTKHPLAAKEKIYLKDLTGCRMALPNRPTDFPYLALLDAAGCDYRMRLGDEENIMLAVERNLAVTIRPRVLADNNYYNYILKGSVCTRTVEDYPMPNSFYIITPPDSRVTPAEKIVIKTVKDCFAHPILP